MKKIILYLFFPAFVFIMLGCESVENIENTHQLAEKSVWEKSSEQLEKSKDLSERKPWQQFQKPSDEELKKILTPLQYEVTQQQGTERPFHNEYWDSKEEGIYVDIISGEPLFSSTDKFDSRTGWPSFTKPLVPENIVEKTDYQLIYPRTEIRSKYSNSHLGHVFDDGPAPAYRRFCMNSAALRFVPKKELEEQEYGEFLYMFE